MASDDVKIATRAALGVVGSILAVGSAIGVPIALANSLNAAERTQQVNACLHLPAHQLACVQAVEWGRPISSASASASQGG